MRRLAHSEWLKLWTVRLPACAIAVLMLFVALVSAAAAATMPVDAGPQKDMSVVLGVVGGVFPSTVMIIIAMLSVGNEYHHRTILATYSVVPHRGRVMSAKLLVLATVGAAVGAIATALSLALVLPISHARNVDSGLVGAAAVTEHVVLSVGVTALSAALGVGVGSCVRNPVVAVVGFLAWSSIGEGIVGALVPSPLLPLGAVQAAVSGGDPGRAWVSAIAVAGYAGAAAVLAKRAYLPKDVTA